MHERYPPYSNHEPELNPTVIIETFTDLGRIEATKQNTKIRTFGSGDEDLSHIAYTASDKVEYELPLNELDEGVLNELLQLGFPATYLHDSDKFDQFFQAWNIEPLSDHTDGNDPSGSFLEYEQAATARFPEESIFEPETTLRLVGAVLLALFEKK